ncbi:MAG: restriction endonuclease [Chitinophagaceae bacterium]|nr:restriction endonuclease [Chitinophagaceae bacterium]
MARKRRNSGSPAELIAGLVIFFVGMPMISPRVRAMYFSAFTSIIAFAAIVGVVVLLIYLIVQALKAKNEPVPAPIRRSPLLRPADGYNDGPSLNFQANKQSAPAQSILTDEDRAELKARYNQSLQNNITLSPENTFDPYKEIPIKTRTWDVSVLREIEWKRFEIVCTEYLRMAGFVAKETKVGADGGVDIIVSKAGDDNFKGIVQCKAWNTYKVGVKPIRELFGIMAADRISTGIFITSGDFTSEAEEFAKGKINLVWGDKFINQIKKLPEEDQKWLLDVALEGDYRTPTCPQCDVKMALRESTKGRNTGGHFWGCVRYPRCKQTLIYKDA